MRGLTIALSLAMALPVAAHGEAASDGEQEAPDWQGVWEGTIGTLPVRACLRGSDDGFSVGSYYYLSRKRPIQLTHEDDGRWVENETGTVTGTWRLQSDGKRLLGAWTNGKRNLPIALTPVAWTSEYGNPCEADAFIAPRLGSVTSTSQPAHLGDFAYSRTSWNVGANFTGVELGSFAYPVTQPGDGAINSALALDPARSEEPVDWRGCVQQSLGSLGLDGEFSYVLEPVVANRAFIVAERRQNGFCGGAHPYAAHDWLVWARDTGERVDLGTWLNAGAFAEQNDAGVESVQISPTFRALAIDHETMVEGECRAIVADAEYWTLGLSSKGLLLSPSLPHVAQACAENAEIPFARLGPFLSPAGQEAVARMR